MTYSRTRVQATVWTEATVRHVMNKIQEDLLSQVYAKLLPIERAQKWCRDLEYLLQRGAVSHFQVQYESNGQVWGLGYWVRSDGLLVADDQSGGNDYFALAGKNPHPSIVVSWNEGCTGSKRAEAEAYLARQGWTNGGKVYDEHATDRVYSRNGLGVERHKIGDW